ncbi:atp18 subunit J of the mitochondrial F1F0 ATP synthase [Diaporthe australafricana]|uniref:Atp18 subunit J of the mitochondrial F1F0 ATP synthase n=1 Tax=Diaporthe australafricana TaxID=127596 RepID=A0ABR3WRA2_9PEZI
MSWLGVTPLKKFPAPVLKPMAPFFAADGGAWLEIKSVELTRVAGIVIAYGINAAQNASMKSDEFKNDPRNPLAKSGGAH